MPIMFALLGRIKPVPPRKLQERQRRWKRCVFTQKRPANIAPGPCYDHNGNVRFLNTRTNRNARKLRFR